jgi:phosphatidylglycerol lysyltransferase
MLARHIVQAYSYKASFEAVNFKKGGIWSYIVLIFSLVFINTFCLFSGATGVAFIVDDAHRKGADLGTATSGAILSQIGYFAGVLVISIIGFVTMMLSGSLNVLFLIGSLLLAGTLLILSSMFFVGYKRPTWLYRLFGWIARPVCAIARAVHHPLSPTWSKDTANSFIKSAYVMSRNPSGTVISIAYASFSAILNMMSIVAIGYAFGFENVAALIGAFCLGAISVILRPDASGRRCRRSCNCCGTNRSWLLNCNSNGNCAGVPWHHVLDSILHWRGTSFTVGILCKKEESYARAA